MQEQARSFFSELLSHGTGLTRRVAPALSVPFRHRWQAVAVALLAGLVVLLGAPGGPAQAASCSGTSLNVVAHQDDDLLFMSPDVLHEVQGGSRCVATVYVTAGDAGELPAYWQGRALGAQAAYAQMAGVANVWTESPLTIGSHPLAMYTLNADTKISLIFMRLPDGNYVYGTGYPSTGNQSLQHLWQGTLSSIDAVNESTSYTRTDLIDTLTGLMSQFQPDLIRTQDSAVGFGHGDHTDHVASALFAVAAQDPSVYTTLHTVTSYIDYLTSPEDRLPEYPQNVFGTDLAAKQAAFYAYGAFDSHTCHDAVTCTRRPEAKWLMRSYVVGTPNAIAGPDQTVVNVGSTVHLNGSASVDPNGGPAYSWTQVSGPLVSLVGANSATPSFTAPAAITTLSFDLTVSDGTLSSTDSVTVAITPNSSNVARQAVATASSENVANSQLASKAIDGFTDGYSTGDYPHEWATLNEPNNGVGAWLNLAWTSPQLIDRVVLYDRPNVSEWIKGGTLTFSDGSTIVVPSLANNGFPVSVSFPARFTTSVHFTVDYVSQFTTAVGLAEIEAWTPADLAPPLADAGPNQTVKADSTVALDGSHSSDPDSGDTLSYAWTQTGRPSVPLSGADTATPTFTAPAEATVLTFRLTVNDGTLSDSSSVIITVNPVSDLSIAKTDSPDPVEAAQTLTYTLAVSNQGPSTATNVEVTDTLPAGTSNVSTSGTDPSWTCNEVSGKVTCTRASLAVGAAPQIQIQVKAPNEGGSISNTASVSATEYYPVPVNNSETQATSVTPVADMKITKTDSPDPVRAAQTLTYTLAVSNQGPSTATNVEVTDTLPAGTSNVSTSGTDPSWTCNEVSGKVTCTRASLAVGAAPQIQIQVKAPNEGGSISNTASVSATEYYPVDVNNSETQATSVDPVADLSITKTDGKAMVDAGSAIAYTIVASNAGPSSALGAVFKDAAVSNLSVSSVTCSDALATGGAVCPTVSATTVALMQGAAGIVIPTLPSGGSVTFTVTGTAGSETQLANTATLDPPSGTTDPTPASAIDTDSVNRAPVANAGPDQSVSTGQPVTLDGSASTDPDSGDARTYKWEQTGGIPVSLSSTTVAKPAFTAPASSTSLAFELTVSDGSLTSSDSVTITVSGNANPAVKGQRRPQTTLLKMKIGHAKHTAFFRFTGSGGKGTLKFECRIDMHHFSPCRVHKSYKHLDRGRHVFRVRARDSAGLADLTLVTKRFTV
jgi:uncharacterized repeat protein (TIGR01451 family)